MATFTFTVTRAERSTGSDETIDWAVTGSGANPASADDFAGGVFPSGTLTFATADTAKLITFDSASDSNVEADETFTVTLSNPSTGSIATATADGTIQNDDVAPEPEPATPTWGRQRWEWWLRRAQEQRYRRYKKLSDELQARIEGRIDDAVKGLPKAAKAAIIEAATEQVEQRIQTGYTDHLTGYLKQYGLTFQAEFEKALAAIREALLDAEIARLVEAQRRREAERVRAAQEEAVRQAEAARQAEADRLRLIEIARQEAQDRADGAELMELLGLLTAAFYQTDLSKGSGRSDNHRR